MATAASYTTLGPRSTLVVQPFVEGVEMLVFAAIPLTCWLCALLAIPHPPQPGDEVQQLVYRRLVGRHQLLIACAVIVTLALALSFALCLLFAEPLS